MESSISKRKIIFFSDKTKSSISEIGGKGYSLHILSNNSINIPSGFILTVQFFEDWIYQVKNSLEWKNYLECKFSLRLFIFDFFFSRKIIF